MGEECCVCYEITSTYTFCNHYVCRSCQKMLDKCPMCRKPLIKIDIGVKKVLFILLLLSSLLYYFFDVFYMIIMFLYELYFVSNSTFWSLISVLFNISLYIIKKINDM